MLPSYKILTKESVLDIQYINEKQHRTDMENLIEQQNKILEKKGFDLSKFYNIHFFENRFTNDCTTDLDIDSAIQCLAIKDGCDLVKYENGRYGYVAYYNGIENGFEILNESEEL